MFRSALWRMMALPARGVEMKALATSTLSCSQSGARQLSPCRLLEDLVVWGCVRLQGSCDREGQQQHRSCRTCNGNIIKRQLFEG